MHSFPHCLHIVEIIEEFWAGLPDSIASTAPLLLEKATLSLKDIKWTNYYDHNNYILLNLPTHDSNYSI